MEFDFKITLCFSPSLHYHCIALCYIKLHNSIQVCLNTEVIPNLKQDGFEIENSLSLSNYLELF